MYGLWWSPQPWYDCICKVFKEMGIKPSLHAPCLFSGTPISGQSPIYIALYVDDFIYFSLLDEIKCWFKTMLQSHLWVDFIGTIKWFLDATMTGLNQHLTRSLSTVSRQPTFRSFFKHFSLKTAMQCPPPICQVFALMIFLRSTFTHPLSTSSSKLTSHWLAHLTGFPYQLGPTSQLPHLSLLLI